MNSALQDFSKKLADLRLWTTDLEAIVLREGDSGIRREKNSRAAIVLLLFGAFEWYLKSLAKDVITSLNSMKVDFEKLPENVRNNHFLGGSVVLKEAMETAKNRAKVEGKSKLIDYSEVEDIARRINSVLGSPPYELLWEAYARTWSNPGPKTVAEILKHLGIKRPWPSIEQHAPNPYDGLAADGALLNKLCSELKELVEARNRLAHGSPDAPVPGFSEVHAYLDATSAIAEGILEATRDAVKTLPRN